MGPTIQGTPTRRIRVLFVAGMIALAAGVGLAGEIDVLEFQPEPPLCRAGRPVALRLVLANRGERDCAGVVILQLPSGLRLLKGRPDTPFAFENGEPEVTICWTVEADREGEHELGVVVRTGEEASVERRLKLLFLNPVTAVKADYIPEPQPVATDLLIGAHNCPLWEADKPEMWRNVTKHPERTPALGLYSQENPEVADWETKWAVEHGISFFVYCWYRVGQGRPVETRFSSALHEALFKSRFQDRIRFAIMWENQARGIAGIENEKDFFEHLLPYWIDNYFRRPNYLVIDGKPLLFIYRPEFLIQDLGSVEAVAQLFAKTREVCRQAGFAGIYLLGEYRGTNVDHLKLMRRLGLDYTFAYVWPVPNNPTPEQAIQAQLAYIRRTQEIGVLPQIVTVSQGWSGWQDEGSIWKLPPQDFEKLLREVATFIKGLPKDQLGSRMILLDNWNEWGEGHYIAPHREFGFGYLDAVRRVFARESGVHLDLIPEDIGLGPYDRPVRDYYRREAELRRRVRLRVAPPAEEEGLVAYWTFDETEGDEVALDHSGHRLGGYLQDIRRGLGWRGRALECRGGCVVVPTSGAKLDWPGLSIECWVKTDQAEQDNKWMVNHVFGGAETTGFRLGLLKGRPCFQIPVTPWSHHLVGGVPLPTGRWVHLAATYDGKMMRLFMDGQEIASMERSGPILENARPIILGGYEVGHPAFFTGWLDEVKLYRRALSGEEVAVRARSAPEGSPG